MFSADYILVEILLVMLFVVLLGAAAVLRYQLRRYWPTKSGQ